MKKEDFKTEYVNGYRFEIASELISAIFYVKDGKLVLHSKTNMKPHLEDFADVLYVKFYDPRDKEPVVFGGKVPEEVTDPDFSDSGSKTQYVGSNRDSSGHNYIWFFMSCRNDKIVDLIDDEWNMARLEGVNIANLMRHAPEDERLNFVYSVTYPYSKIIAESPAILGMEHFKREIITELFGVDINELYSFPFEYEGHIIHDYY